MEHLPGFVATFFAAEPDLGAAKARNQIRFGSQAEQTVERVRVRDQDVGERLFFQEFVPDVDVVSRDHVPSQFLR